MRNLKKMMILAAAVLTMASCKLKDEPVYDNFRLSTALSIFVNDEGKVGVSSLVNENYNSFTEYWVNGEKVKLDDMKNAMPNGSNFRTTIDLNYLTTSVFRKSDGAYAEYKFFRNYVVDYGVNMFYFKNGEKIGVDTTAMGAIHAVDATDGEAFVGLFGTQTYDRYYGTVMKPTKAFYMDSNKKIHTLPMPDNYFYFTGVSSIHKSGNDVYIAGLMDFPMYWKNNDMVRLPSNNRYGEVSQIATSGSDVYAVGYYDKPNANIIGHTACYWKNGVLTELEDGAVTNAAFIDKSGNVYIAGAKGKTEKEYKACYWKNGERVDLEK